MNYKSTVGLGKVHNQNQMQQVLLDSKLSLSCCIILRGSWLHLLSVILRAVTKETDPLWGQGPYKGLAYVHSQWIK